MKIPALLVATSTLAIGLCASTSALAVPRDALIEQVVNATRRSGLPIAKQPVIPDIAVGVLRQRLAAKGRALGFGEGCDVGAPEWREAEAVVARKAPELLKNADGAQARRELRSCLARANDTQLAAIAETTRGEDSVVHRDVFDVPASAFAILGSSDKSLSPEKKAALEQAGKLRGDPAVLAREKKLVEKLAQLPCYEPLTWAVSDGGKEALEVLATLGQEYPALVDAAAKKYTLRAGSEKSRKEALIAQLQSMYPEPGTAPLQREASHLMARVYVTKILARSGEQLRAGPGWGPQAPEWRAIESDVVANVDAERKRHYDTDPRTVEDREQANACLHASDLGQVESLVAFTRTDDWRYLTRLVDIVSARNEFYLFTIPPSLVQAKARLDARVADAVKAMDPAGEDAAIAKATRIEGALHKLQCGKLLHPLLIPGIRSVEYFQDHEDELTERANEAVGQFKKRTAARQ